jgi:hypothetical protein
MSAVPTLFSFGYWGWGNATKELVESIDLVERARGFAPPRFVDTRLQRNVRAAGFNGTAFERLIGEERYRWLDGLGNPGIRDGGPMRIKDPAAASSLLDIALERAGRNARVLFFCACEKPCECHRSVVARLVLDAARQRNVAIEIVEWPGGEPALDVAVALPGPQFEKVRRGAKSIPLPEDASVVEMAALPWYSTVRVSSEDEDSEPSWRLISGPARYQRAGWYLPVYGAVDAEPEGSVRAEVERARQVDGYSLRRSIGE